MAAVGEHDPSSLYLSARYLRGLVDHVRATGADALPVIEAMGLTEDELREPDRRILHALQDDAFAMAERVTGDSNVGLHAGTSMHVVHFGIVGQLAMTCHTGGELLDLQVRYQGLIGNGVRSTYVRTDREIVLEFDIARFGPSRHSLEYTLAAQVTLARLLAGPEFVLTRFEFQYPEPPQPHEQVRVFGCPVRYGCQKTSAHFPLRVHDLVLSGGDPGARAALEIAARQRLDALQVQMQHVDRDVARAQQYVADRLSTGAPSVEQTAAAMDTSVRTLQRRLKEHGLSYRDVVEQARREVAEKLMADASLSLLDVALLVGFADQSAFNRAFRRWFQATPSELREQRLKASARG